jgi:hypothetical protein
MTAAVVFQCVYFGKYGGNEATVGCRLALREIT